MGPLGVLLMHICQGGFLGQIRLQGSSKASVQSLRISQGGIHAARQDLDRTSVQTLRISQGDDIHEAPVAGDRDPLCKQELSGA